MSDYHEQQIKALWARVDEHGGRISNLETVTAIMSERVQDMNTKMDSMRVDLVAAISENKTVAGNLDKKIDKIDKSITGIFSVMCFIKHAVVILAGIVAIVGGIYALV